MEWIFLIVWLLIINGALGGQYVLNWMGNQERFAGKAEITPGIMTWWREISKFMWALIAVIMEVVRGKELRYLWPGLLSMVTLVICAFTGVIENIGFFYLPRYYSPHVFAPYVNVYLVFLPFFGKLLFNAPIRKEHWIGITLVVIGLSIPHVEVLFSAHRDPRTILDTSAIVWIIIINICLCTQQILNNKTVQTALQGVGANALVLWREIWKLLFISSAIIIFPLIANALRVHIPATVPAEKFETVLIVNPKLDSLDRMTLQQNYVKTNDQYVLKNDIAPQTQEAIKKDFIKADYSRFFSLFEGKLFPNNWLPILFVVAAGLTGYIYSFGFFKLSKFAAHFWVPYTNIYFAILPFIMLLFGENVNRYQIIGAAVLTLGLIVGVSDHSKNKVEEIEKKNK
jgi:drug/metabolite transporter (DMT)-like permease